jgi:hypothetical protein
LSGIPLAAGQAAAVYGQLPLSFEANQGQTDPQVNFLARGQGYALFLTPTEAVLNLGQGSGVSDAFAPQGQGSEEVLRMELVGGNAGAQAVGLQQLPGTSNYFVGNDSSKWHTGIATYGQVEYQQVYRGIDLVYYGNQSGLEYDFVVAPGGDPNQIALRFDGVQSVHVDAQGNLVLHAATGDVVEQAPVVYQGSGAGGQGSEIRSRVAGGYVLGSDGLVHFQVGAYDHAAPLVIDPVLIYSTFLGGSSTDEAHAIAVDSAGNAYITGFTLSVDFPTMNALQAGLLTVSCVFISKMNATGTALAYSTYLGGTEPASNHILTASVGNGIAVDAAGNAYIAGSTFSTDFPLVNPLISTFSAPGTGPVHSSIPEDGFVAMLNPAGTALVYSTYLGGKVGFNKADAIAVDAGGNAYVTGTTESADFPITANAFQATLTGGSNAFVTKISAGGKSFAYSTYLGGSTLLFSGTHPSVDEGFGIAVDPAGTAYVTGETDADDFPTKNPFQPHRLNRGFGFNGFVTEVNASGSALVYSSYLGGSGDSGHGQGDQATAIALDTAGNAYVAGTTSSADFPTTPGAWQRTYGGGFLPFADPGYGFSADAFVTKVAAGGQSLVYSTYLGGNGADQALGIAVDAAGDAYVVGQTASFLTPTPYPARILAESTLLPDAAIDVYGAAFMAKLNPAGSALVNVTYLDGANRVPIPQVHFVPLKPPFASFATAVALDAAGNAYVTGSAYTSDFPTANALQPTYGGSGDAFITKINPTLFQDPRNARFVSKVYQDLLRQSADTTAVSEWSLVLDQGLRGFRVALALTHSTAYYTGVIGDLYQKYLKRAPDPTGLRDDLFFLLYPPPQTSAGGVSQFMFGRIEQVAAAIVGSDEYFQVRGGGTLQGWEQAIYKDVFGRPIDMEGESGINTAIGQQGFTREQVGEVLFTSVEYRYDLVQGFYQTFLGRAASQTEAVDWLLYLQPFAPGEVGTEAHRDEEIVAYIVGSPEYLSHV